ncbi:conserved hypothetical protein [Culex quinquefasciatus]|uniref:Uncharacterized protein n=1 Tax=Culex quinquefasciatus TaxID=7176 RepID=B0WCC6_CULQU|nr:conserved hypothetical protein [Culex quinquefasciatus]|eukprot:XP_001846360.1 conserved hypothetical protein [Culex quinquefasciatus]
MDTVMELIKPPYNFDNSCYFDEENKIRFEPPIYEQRYLTVLRLLELDLWKDSFKKVVEFGCAEMKFFTLLKTLQGVEQILECRCVDPADKGPAEENGALKEKITSLRSSALQIKQLYEAELGKNRGKAKESIKTQTDEPVEVVAVTTTTTTTTVGTNTTLRNIRRRLDYVRKTENLAGGGFTIKKEETISPASSIQNLPTAVAAAAVAAAAPPTEVNPQLTQIWALLGETMFRLLGNGRMFDSQQQCFNTINERLAMVNSLIDPEAVRRGPSATQLMMSEALAAAAAQAAMLGDGARKVTPVVKRAASVPAGGKGGDDYEADVAEEASNEPWEDVPSERSPEMPDEEEETPEQRPVMEVAENVIQQQEQEQVVSEFTETASEALPEIEESVVESLPPELEEEFVTSLPTIEQPVNTSSSTDETKEIENCSKEQSPAATSAVPSNEEPEKFPQESAPFEPEQEPVEIQATSSIEPTQIRPDSPPAITPNEIPSARSPTPQEPALNQSLPAEFTLADLSDSDGAGKKHYLDVRLGDDGSDSATATDDEESTERMMIIVEGSPARSMASSSCTSIGSNGTLISPIKVRETNDLVKDQFKTPTSPAISKRKLRERADSGSSAGSSRSSAGARNPKKRGRLSPETESLLEDDWDRKFSTIKDYFALPSSLNPIDSGVMWDDEDDEDMDEEFKMPLEPLSQTIVKEERKVAPVLEEPKPSTSTAPWNDFKVPLQIDVPPSNIATTDSPESPPLEDSPMSPDAEEYTAEDSPMSPLPEDDGTPLCYDSPMSPPPESRGSMYTVESRVIPLNNPLASRLSQEYNNTPIGKTIARYSSGRRAEVLRNMAPEMAPKEAGMVRRIVALIQRHVAAEWTVENVQRSCAEILALTDNTRLISVAVMDFGVAQQDLVLDVQCSPPAPVLPKTVQQLVLLVKTMNEKLFTLDKVLLHEIDRRVFTLKAGADKVMLETVTTLTYLYIGMSDSSRLYGCTARLFMYKCLYYFNFKGLPLIYLVLKAFPHALPKKGSVYYDNSDAMVSTIRTVLMNINFMERSHAQDATLYKKAELMKLFKYFYGYQPGQPTYDELITNLVEKIKANKLKNVDYCLILVAKRKGYEWAKDAIVQKHLYPLLNDYLKQLEHADRTDALDDRICCLIFTISAILKTQPNFQDVSRFMQMFGNIVQLAGGNQRVQEAAVAGLVRFTRFGFADIYEWLCRWCPSYEVSGRTKLMLATFVHRKDARFWKQLNQGEIV